MRATTLLAAATLLLSSSGWAVEELPAKAPWTGSTFIYENTFSAVSLDPGAELTYNPYFAHSLSFRPEYHPPFEQVYVRARLDVEQELTNADDTSRKHQWLWSDLLLDAVADGVTEPRSGIKVGGHVRFVLPLSKLAAAQTLRLGIGPALALSRKFPVLEGLTVRYGGRFTINFHKYTTAQQDAPGITCGNADGPECGRFIHTGYRNSQMVLTQGPTVLFAPIKDLEITLSYTFLYNRLYALGAATVATDAGTLTLNGDGNVPERFGQWFVADASYTLFDFLTVSAGVSSLFPTLTPDSTYRTPFFNRFTNLYVDLAVDVDGVVNKFKK